MIELGITLTKYLTLPIVAVLIIGYVLWRLRG